MEYCGNPPAVRPVFLDVNSNYITGMPGLCVAAGVAAANGFGQAPEGAA